MPGVVRGIKKIKYKKLEFLILRYPPRKKVKNTEEIKEQKRKYRTGKKVKNREESKEQGRK